MSKRSPATTRDVIAISWGKFQVVASGKLAISTLIILFVLVACGRAVGFW
jgi:hypothetical protein